MPTLRLGTGGGRVTRSGKRGLPGATRCLGVEPRVGGGVSGQPPTRPADIHVHAVGIRLALGRRGGHGRHAQVGGIQVLLGPLPVVRLVVQVREDHGLLELRKGMEQRVMPRGAGLGGAGTLDPRLTRNFLASRPSSPHSFWLSSMRAPSEEFFRGLGVTGPGRGVWD